MFARFQSGPWRPVLSLEHLEDRTTPSAEFAVNTITTDIQSIAEVASAAVTGHSVVAFWNTGTGFANVMARVFDPQGQPIGPEFQVNPTGSTSRFDVAMDADGDFVVVWEGTEPDASIGPGGVSSAIYARLYNSEGVAQGSEFVVPSLTEQGQSWPAVAMDGLGGFTVVWQGAGPRIPGQNNSWEFGIYGRSFSPGGVPTGPQFEVVQSRFEGVPLPGGHSLADVARGSAGDVVVAWEYDVETTVGSPNDIMIRRFSPAGTPLGDPERMNQTVGPDYLRPSVAAISATDYIVAWHELGDANQYDVFARRISPTTDSGQFQVNANTAGQQRFPEVALDGAGRFLVAWEDPGSLGGAGGTGDGSSFGVFARRFEADGTPMEAVEFGVNLTTIGSQGSVAVAADACGGFIAVWHGAGAPGQDSIGVYGRRFVFPEANDAAHRQDSDGDGLPDCWEMHGYHVLVLSSETGDGELEFVDLPGMGADPLRKDLFVEVDWMSGGDHSHKPKPEALRIVRDAFARAPVPNADGSTGITLHIDAGWDSLMAPGPDKLWNTADDLIWGGESLASVLPHQDTLGQNVTPGDPDAEYDWSTFDVIRDGPDGIASTSDDRFSPARVAAFHYCMFIHDLGDNVGVSGISRNGDDFFAGGGDFIVSLGSWDNGVGSVLEQAGTFMHEFGHNLGLSHGGGTSHIQYKPNYLSVMNYSFQTRGLMFDDPAQPGGVLPGWFDYSRFELPSLDENHLNETVGLRGNPPDPALTALLANYGTTFYAPGGFQRTISYSDAINWNDDFDTTDLDVSVNINDSENAQGNPTFGIMVGANDWANLVYTGGGIGQLGASLPRVTSTHVDSITAAGDALLPRLQGVSVDAPDVEMLAPGDERTLTFSVRNTGSAEATFTLTPSATRPWADFSGVPTIMTLAPGASQDVTIPVIVPAAPASTVGFAVNLTVVHDENMHILDQGIAILGEPSRAPDAGRRAIAVGGSNTVKVLNPDGTERLALTSFDASFTGGVRVASADFNGDGVADIVVGTGPGTPTLVRILSGANGSELFGIAPFEAAFTGGVYVAVGDLTGDGVPDLVITPDEGGGPRVQLYSGAGYTKFADFFGIDDSNFRGGARAAIGDFTGDGTDDLVIAAGFGGGPRIAVFDGTTLTTTRSKPINDFFLFEETLRNGAFVAAGDVNGDGRADLIGGGGPGGGPRVFVVSGHALMTVGPAEAIPAPLANFFAGNTDNRGGIRVSAKHLDADSTADIVVGSGDGAGSRVTAYLGSNLSGGDTSDIFALDAFPGFDGGIFVG